MDLLALGHYLSNADALNKSVKDFLSTIIVESFSQYLWAPATHVNGREMIVRSKKPISGHLSLEILQPEYGFTAPHFNVHWEGLCETLGWDTPLVVHRYAEMIVRRLVMQDPSSCHWNAARHWKGLSELIKSIKHPTERAALGFEREITIWQVRAILTHGRLDELCELLRISMDDQDTLGKRVVDACVKTFWAEHDVKSMLRVWFTQNIDRHLYGSSYEELLLHLAKACIERKWHVDIIRMIEKSESIEAHARTHSKLQDLLSE